jgi:hypothetical protein
MERVMISGQLRQNHIRRYSLWTRTWIREGSRSWEYVVELSSLLHVENEIEDAGGDTQAEKVQEFVVKWEYMDEVREAEERKREHDQDRKRDKPLVEGMRGIAQIGTQQREGRLTGRMRRGRSYFGMLKL